jgi:hypothetical protein
VSAGDNHERLHSEVSFADLCGTAPIDASSGLIKRKRLNPRGDRAANEALWRIVMVRMNSDPETRRYVNRRTEEGKSKREIIRCLKRYVARQVFNASPRPSHPLTTDRSFRDGQRGGAAELSLPVSCRSYTLETRLYAPRPEMNVGASSVSSGRSPHSAGRTPRHRRHGIRTGR